MAVQFGGMIVFANIGDSIQVEAARGVTFGRFSKSIASDRKTRPISVRENVQTTLKIRKKSCFFGISKKNV